MNDDPCAISIHNNPTIYSCTLRFPPRVFRFNIRMRSWNSIPVTHALWRRLKFIAPWPNHYCLSHSDKPWDHLPCSTTNIPKASCAHDKKLSLVTPSLIPVPEEYGISLLMEPADEFNISLIDAAANWSPEQLGDTPRAPSGLISPPSLDYLIAAINYILSASAFGDGFNGAGAGASSYLAPTVTPRERRPTQRLGHVQVIYFRKPSYGTVNDMLWW